MFPLLLTQIEAGELALVADVEPALAECRKVPVLSTNLRATELHVFVGICRKQKQLTFVGKNEKIVSHHDHRGIIFAKARLFPFYGTSSNVDANEVPLRTMAGEKVAVQNRCSEIDLHLLVRP